MDSCTILVGRRRLTRPGDRDAVLEGLDATYARVVGVGYEGRRESWYASWGQRYAMLGDPDGNRVDPFAALTEDGQE